MDVFVTTPELVGILMVHVSHSEGPRMTLTNCARVNLLFSNEALRVLWREISSMNHFLGLLPPEVASLLTDPVTEKTDTAHDPSKWARVLRYASFVRHVDLSSHYSRTRNNVDHLNNIINAFYTTFGDQVFFRNLRRSDGLKLCASSHLTLLSPSLQHLEVSITPKEATALESMIRGIQRLTSLKSLQVHSIPALVLDDLSNLVPKAEGLTRLSLYLKINLDQLYSIQRFCNLRHLLLDVAFLKVEEDQFEVSPMTMPQLQELEIIGFSRVVAQLIRDVLPMPKESLRLQLIIDPYSERDQALSSLMSSIGTLAPLTLKTVDISYNCLIRLPYHTYYSSVGSHGMVSIRTGRTIDMDMVRPVFQLEQLQKLRLNLKTPVKISRDALHDLIRGLPHIHHLDLVGLNKRMKPIFTPSSLFILAREAPQLRYLGMEMDGDWWALRKELEFFSSSSHLQTLNIGYSKLNVEERDQKLEDEVFSALKRLFPLLQTLDLQYARPRRLPSGADQVWWNLSDRFEVKPVRCAVSSTSHRFITFRGEAA
ncbi:hypothetical protein FRC03_011103 [Tulasnella sp. 419]|nr:hypothetical protein FRC03_011103 [Tulasnella sp. 419]